ncbi:30S ribosomal protein S9 [Candidatus Magnetoovum chiemensis]|nr:30S ribosomal protein S9 [Candidatus Magnetoovum chiemensis]
MPEIRYSATGKRKTSISRVIIKQGGGTSEGNITVNNKPAEEYFKRETLMMMIKQPLEITGMLGKYSVTANVKGGGLAGQAGAVRHGISVALQNLDSDLRPKLKKEGFLTRDSRIKERKKYGQKAARKRFQFSKR